MSRPRWVPPWWPVAVVLALLVAASLYSIIAFWDGTSP